MRKIVAGFIGLFAIAVFLTPATADNSFADPAVVIRDGFFCGLIDGDGLSVIVDTNHVVITSSGQGKITCKADVANSQGRAVIWNNANTGFPCSTGSDLTVKWHETVSASGKATLTCQNDG